MSVRPETLPARITAALAVGAATALLGALYYEAYGESCAQRSRLEHFLRQYLSRQPAAGLAPTPKKKTVMGYKFKDGFADVSAIVHYPDRTKEVDASNLTAEDAERLIAGGHGHLLETVSDADADTAKKGAKPTLSTRTSGQNLELKPDLVPLMVPAPAAGESDAHLHDVAEAQARQAQADADAQRGDAPDLKVEVVN